MSHKTLTTPLSFSAILEAWITIQCGACGRGGFSTPLFASAENASQSKLQFSRLLETWVGNFCTECGRGGHRNSDFKTQDLGAMTTTPNLTLTSKAKSECRVVTPLLLFHILKQWIESGCIVCKRGKGYAAFELTLTPISFEMLAKAWAGPPCNVCGLGGHQTTTRSNQFATQALAKIMSPIVKAQTANNNNNINNKQQQEIILIAPAKKKQLQEYCTTQKMTVPQTTTMKKSHMLQEFLQDKVEEETTKKPVLKTRLDEPSLLELYMLAKKRKKEGGV